MPRPSTKAELLAESQDEYNALEKLIAPLSAEQMTQAGVLGAWSVKDVLAHLYEWQQMFFSWYQAGLCGENPQPPGRGYKWNQLPALNHEIYETYREMPVEEILAKFRASHQQTMALVQSLAEEELFAPGRFGWLGKHSLATYISANTGSHYRWARTDLRKMLPPKKDQGQRGKK